MFSTVLDVTTGRSEVVLDITRECEAVVRDSGVRDGLLNVFVPHATAGIAVIETGAGVTGGEVSRDNVAAVIAAALADDSTIRRVIEFNDGDTPIAEAIHAG